MLDHSATAPTATPGRAAGWVHARSRGWARAVRRLLAGRAVRWSFVLAVVALGGYAVFRQWRDVRTALADLGLVAVGGAMLAVLVAMVAAMQVWRVLLAAFGSPLSVRVAARVVFVGQLGKYLPGSIWPIVAQMELGSAHQVPRRRSATASVLTLLVSLLAGLLAALVTLPFVAGPAMPYRWAFVMAPVLLVGLHPRVLNPALDRLLRLARRPAPEQPLTGRAVATAFAWALVSWLLYGVQIWLLTVRLGAPAGQAALLAVGGFAFAWSVGFLVVFAPAGAGVREVLLIATLSGVLGVGRATAVALVSRVLMTVGDLITAALAMWSGRLHARAVDR